MELYQEVRKYLKYNFNPVLRGINLLSKGENSNWIEDSYQSDSSVRSRKMKSRIHRKLPLIGVISLYQASKELKRVHAEILVTYTFIRLLVLFAADKIYVKLAERLIPKCLKYSMCIEGFYLTNLLDRRYSDHFIHSRHYNRNRERMTLFESELFAELKVQKYYSSIVKEYRTSKNHNELTIQRLDNYINEIKLLDTKISNPKFYVYKYSILLFKSELNNNYNESILLCDEALSKISDLTYKYDRAIRVFTGKKIDALLNMKNFHQAEKIANKSSKSYCEHSLDWVRFQEQLISIYMRQLKIVQAHKVYVNINNLKKSFISEQFIERLKIYGIYFSVFIDKKSPLISKISDLSVSNKDLKGMNIALVIAQLTQSAINRDFEYLESQKGSVKSYLLRYCTDNPRSKLFIRAIINLPKAYQNWDNWRIQNNRFLVRMAAATDSVEHLEVIDYNYLWDYICKYALSDLRRYKVYMNTSENRKHEIAEMN